jgi:hypothetical protein
MSHIGPIFERPFAVMNPDRRISADMSGVAPNDAGKLKRVLVV